jgi:hypothetical protein
MDANTSIFIPKRDGRFTHRLCCQCFTVWNHNKVPPACGHPPCPGCKWARGRNAKAFNPECKAPKDWKCRCGTIQDIDNFVWGMIGCCDDPWLEDIYDDEGRDYFRGHNMTFGRDLKNGEDLVKIQKWLYTFEEVWKEHVEPLNWLHVDDNPQWVREEELSVRDLLAEASKNGEPSSTSSGTL